ncbi:hypothetical protein [Halobacteriovorax sp. ZH2_bin.1]
MKKSIMQSSTSQISKHTESNKAVIYIFDPVGETSASDAKALIEFMNAARRHKPFSTTISQTPSSIKKSLKKRENISPDKIGTGGISGGPGASFEQKKYSK